MFDDVLSEVSEAIYLGTFLHGTRIVNITGMMMLL